MSHGDWWFVVDVAKAAGVWAIFLLGYRVYREDQIR